MKALTLTLRDGAPAQRIDLAGILPEPLARLSTGDIARLLLPVGNRAIALGEVFAVDGTPGEVLAFAGTNARCDHIGAGMTAAGVIHVEGDAGAFAGEGLDGGTVVIDGNAGPHAARAMAGGYIAIRGGAGEGFAGASPGTRRGMRGGVAYVQGSVGDRAGEFLRRGLVIVGGDAGDYLGARATAGTIMVTGRAGDHAGWSMKRATLLLAKAPKSMPPGYGDAGVHELPYPPLLWRTILRRGWMPAAAEAERFLRVRRYAGDSQVGGLAEILIEA